MSETPPVRKPFQPLTMTTEMFRSIVSQHGGVACPLYSELIAHSNALTERTRELQEAQATIESLRENIGNDNI